MIARELILATFLATEPDDPELFFQWLEGEGYSMQLACINSPSLRRNPDGTYSHCARGQYSAGKWVVNLCGQTWDDDEVQRKFMEHLSHEPRAYRWENSLVVKFESPEEGADTVYSWLQLAQDWARRGLA